LGGELERGGLRRHRWNDLNLWDQQCTSGQDVFMPRWNKLGVSLDGLAAGTAVAMEQVGIDLDMVPIVLCGSL
jgi:hypothetical protein